MHGHEKRARQAGERFPTTVASLRLGEVPQGSAGLWIDLLRVEPDVVGVCEQGLELVLRLADAAAAEREVLHRPEAADPEGALAGGEATVVTPQQPGADLEPLADPPPGRTHARGIRRTVAVPGKEEEACVHVAARERAGVALQQLAPAAGLDLL